MFLFRHGAQVLRASTPHMTSRAASRIAIPLPSAPPPVPVIETCPSPTCGCRATPPNLDIERETNLNGSMASYGEQILLCTGNTDWKSKIEDEEDAGLLRQLKKFLVRGGKYVDPYHNVLITNSSFSTRPDPQSGKDPDAASTSLSAFLLPTFQFVPSIPAEPEVVEAFVKAFVLPEKLHKSYDALPTEQRELLMRQPEGQQFFPRARNVNEILVLICGHGGRDDRCGKLGPVLKDEFEEKLQRQNIDVLREAPDHEQHQIGGRKARVGTISHIGGHKWAGNVIVYIPPSFSDNPLAGKGIWYGRVAPEHVEGIVTKTIVEGQVIKELFRGGIDRSGEIIRL